MENFTLLKDGEKYGGKYVATESFSSQRIISTGSDAKIVRKEAQDRGYEHPVVFYVPQKGAIHIY